MSKGLTNGSSKQYALDKDMTVTAVVEEAFKEQASKTVNVTLIEYESKQIVLQAQYELQRGNLSLHLFCQFVTFAKSFESGKHIFYVPLRPDDELEQAQLLKQEACSALQGHQSYMNDPEGHIEYCRSCASSMLKYF